MKHNEFKAFFKKKLDSVLSEDFEVVSIDEQTSSRKMFILDKKSLKVVYLITSFWGTKEFHIQLFEITESYQTGEREFHTFQDADLDITGNYLQTHLFNEIFEKLKNKKLILF